MPDGLTADLERWKHATEAATPGPWEAHSHQRQYSIWHDELDQPLAREVRNWDDAVFISAASVAMPRLVAAVEAAIGFHVEAVAAHVRPTFRYCKTCSGHPPWPCPEVRAITRELGAHPGAQQRGGGDSG